MSDKVCIVCGTKYGDAHGIGCPRYTPPTSDEIRGKLIEASTMIRSAKNDLVLAAIVLETTGKFDNTVNEMKETAYDLSRSMQLIDDHIS